MAWGSAAKWEILLGLCECGGSRNGRSSIDERRRCDMVMKDEMTVCATEV
jgi:hypothetical protein